MPARLLVVLLLPPLAALAGCGGSTDQNGDRVPTFEVKEGPFTRTVTAEGLLKPVRTTILYAPTKVEAMTVSWLLPDGSLVKKGDLIVRFDSTDAIRWLEDGKSEREAAERRIEKEQTVSDSSLHERERVAAVTKEELRNARQLGKKDPRFFPRQEVIESEIDEGIYNTRIEHADITRGVQQRLARSRIDLLSIDRQRADRRTSQAKHVLATLELRAAQEGTFLLERWGSRRGMLKAGDRAWPGMRIGEIATPQEMTAEVYILESDAGGLTAGKPATVVLEARPDVSMKAHVARVDPFPKQIEPDVPAQYFATSLKFDGDTTGLKPGQRLHATVVLDEQPVALVVPRQAVFKNDDKTVVYRRSYAGAGFDRVRVQLGAGTIGRIVVAAGLRPGDVVALRDPAKSLDETVAGSQAAGPSGRPPGMPVGPGGGRSALP